MVYGSLLEDVDAINESAYINSRPGLFTLMEQRSNADSVPVYESDNGYIIGSTDLQKYFECSGSLSVEEAVDDILYANNISEATVVYDNCDPDFDEMLQESQIIYERAVEDGAMSVKQAMKWYNKFVTASRTKAENKEMVKERIKVLKECKKQMEDTLTDVNGQKAHGRLMYTLKGAFIPFNGIYRLIKRQDAYAGIGAGVNLAGNAAKHIIRTKSMEGIAAGAGAAMSSLGTTAGVESIKGGLKGLGASSIVGWAVFLTGIVIRCATYSKMLEASIKKTDAAIEYLEDKLKEL